MTVNEYVYQVQSEAKTLAGIILEGNRELLNNMLNVINVGANNAEAYIHGVEAYMPEVTEWDISTHESVARHIYEFNNYRARQQKATILRRQVLLALREDQDTTVTLEQFAREYYKTMGHHNMLDLLRP